MRVRGHGAGKTVAVEQALHLLPGRVPVWRAVVGVRPGLPQVRAALCEALGLPSGSLTHRAGPADQALAEALTEPGVLFLDDAQRLSPPVLDYLRQLWDSPGCTAALVLCGAGSERALARAAAMRSRVLTWHQVSRLDTEDVRGRWVCSTRCGRTLIRPTWCGWMSRPPAATSVPGRRSPRMSAPPGPRPRCGSGARRDRPGMRPAWPVLVTARPLSRARRTPVPTAESLTPFGEEKKRRDDGQQSAGHQRGPWP
ncbi:ATP-binding protein [Streptomyces sp. DHE7-1]|nr:ATP-binding protein [Streptomyces sp. DHE7-1]